MDWQIDGLPKPRNKRDYQKLSHIILKDRIEQIESNDWELVNEAEDLQDIRIETKKLETSNIVAVRTTGFIKLQDGQSIHDLCMMIFNPTEEFQMKIYESVSEYEKLENIDHNILLGRTVASGTGMTDREFIAIRTYKKINDEYIMAVQSINTKRYPLDNNYVRGTFRTGLKISPVTDRVVQVIMFAHIDPRGWIPDILINYHVHTSGDWIKRV